MRKPFLLVATILTLIQLIACDAGSKLDKGLAEIKAMRLTLEQQSKEWQITADNMQNAIPGERYLRLIDAAHSDDPEKREWAQRFATSLLKLNLDKDYEVSIEFGYDETKSIRAHFWQFDKDGDLAVKYHIENKMFNPTPVRNSLKAYTPRKDLIVQTKKNVKKIIENFNVYYTNISEQSTEFYSERTTQNLFRLDCATTIGREKFCNQSIDIKITDLKRSFHDDLFKVLESAIDGLEQSYNPIQEVAAQPSITGDWNPIINPLLFIAIPVEDWNRLSGDITVRAYVHVAGDKAKTLAKQRPYVFRKEEFQVFKTSHSSVPGGAIMWASHNMNNLPILTANMQAKIEELNNILHENDTMRGSN